jgi:uncharacterized membrane protein required for colicin V production
MNVAIGWFDALALVMVAFGVWHGRKRGMSEELLGLLKWVLVVALAGAFYRPTGRWIATLCAWNPHWCAIGAYAGIALAVLVLAMAVQHSLDAKLAGTDAFGRGEFYLGMLSGAVRHLCILLAAMALLNGPRYSAEEIAATAKFQTDNFGNIDFPTVAEVQNEVFQKSYAGKFTRTYLPMLLVQPPRPEGKPLVKARASGGTRPPAK